MKEYKKYVKKLEDVYLELESALHNPLINGDINKLSSYLQSLENEKIELNKYINKQKVSDDKISENMDYIMYNVYPHLVDKNYDRKILEHIILQQFYNPDNPLSIKTKSKYTIFKLNAVQKMMRNFLGPNTPYNNMMLIHDPGTGKTCTAITIAENLKKYTRMNNKRIYIIRPDAFREQLFEMEKVKTNKLQYQCTGTTYLDEVRKSNPINDDYLFDCIKGDNDACIRLKRNINREIEKYYQFSNLMKWAKTVDAEIQQKTHTAKSETEKLKKKIEVIRSLFNNNLIIIDEAHKLRDETSEGGDERLVVRILNDICLYSQGMKLLLLTATPMYDRPTEIVPLLNFMLLNDKRPPLKERDIFINDNGELSKFGEQKLIYAIRGYISYMRGNNPDEFPIKLEADVNLPSKYIMNKYPTKSITGERILKRDTIQYLTLVNTPLGKEQQDVLLNININEEGEIVQGVAYQAQLQAGNFIYQTMKDSKGIAKECYGSRGIENIMSLHNGTYSFKDPEFAKELIGSSLKKYSAKFALLLDTIKKSNGPVFIYSNFISGGILPLTFILELNGYKRYNGDKQLLSSPYKSSENVGEYVYFTGNERKSVLKYLNKRENMINEPVKIFICSQVASEGFNLFGYRESHILDPWYNMSSLEQTIGRCIRRGSHSHLPEKERNVTVYLYANTFTGNMSDVESYDLRVYNIIEKKAINTGKIQSIIKENAIDCAILKRDNTRLRKDYPKKRELVSSHGKKIMVDLYDKPYTQAAFYQDKIIGSCSTDNYNITKSSKSINLSMDTILDFDMTLLDIEIREIIEIIKQELIINDNLLFIDIVKLINDNIAIKYDKITIKKILEYMKHYFKENNINIINRNGIASRIVITSNGLRLLTLDNINPLLSMQKQLGLIENIKVPAIPFKSSVIKDYKKVDNIDLIPFINVLKKGKKEKLDKDNLDYNKIISNIETKINNIINFNIHDKYNSISLAININNDTHYMSILKMIFEKLIYKEKEYLIQKLIYFIKAGKTNFTNFELKLLDCIKYNIVYNYEVISGVDEINNNLSLLKNKNNIYGFIIANKFNLTLYKYTDNIKKLGDKINNYFVIDKSKVDKIINERYSIIKSNNLSKILGFIEYNKSEFQNPVFKIIDYEAKGVKKSVKGIACSSKLISGIYDYINKINGLYNSKIETAFDTKNKHRNCNNLEIIMRVNTSNNLRSSGENILFLNPEQFWIWRSKMN